MKFNRKQTALLAFVGIGAFVAVGVQIAAHAQPEGKPDKVGVPVVLNADQMAMLSARLAVIDGHLKVLIAQTAANRP